MARCFHNSSLWEHRHLNFTATRQLNEMRWRNSDGNFFFSVISLLYKESNSRNEYRGSCEAHASNLFFNRLTLNKRCDFETKQSVMRWLRTRHVFCMSHFVRVTPSMTVSFKSSYNESSIDEHAENVVERHGVKSTGRSRNIQQWKWSRQYKHPTRRRWHWIKICLIQFLWIYVFLLPPLASALAKRARLMQVATAMLMKLWEMKSDFIKHSKRPFNSPSAG